MTLKETDEIALKDKRIVVTGGGGFLGGYVVKALEKRGCTNVVVPRSREYDLREKSAIIKLYTQAQPQVVIHLAAVVGGIGINQKNPGSFFYDNAVMGIQLMELARQFSVEKFVAAGTICAYPKFSPVPFKEDDLWKGYPEETNAPYGIAKKILLTQSQAYREQYGFNSIFLLPVNLYGPNDNFDLESSHVIPALIRKCVEAKERGDSEIILWGDGTPTREFLYVEDAAEGILKATEKYHQGLPVNLGSGDEITIAELATLVSNEVGFSGEIRWDKTKPNGQPRRQLDVSRAEKFFGFRSKVSLGEGIKRTVAWYHANHHKYKKASSL